jgi:GPH family glycoside/pentoside/hexuronide:cation symporter
MRLDAAPYSKAWYGKTGASPRRRKKIRHPPEAVADAEGPVPQSVRFAYATGAIAYGIKDNGFSVFLLLFYNQIIGLDAGMVGLMLFFALVADAIIDPSVGHLTDRTRSRWGRRHPWLYASALPIAGFWILLWMPPEASDAVQYAWLFVFAMLVRMSLSLNEVPSVALAPEMTPDYHERTALLGLRSLLGWTGGLIILALAFGLFRLADPEHASRDDFFAYAVTGAAIMFITVMTSALGTHRRFARPVSGEVHHPGLRDMLEVARFRPYQILLLAFFFAFANQGVTFALSSYLLAFVWKLGPTEQVVYSLVLFFGVATALVLARKAGLVWGKRITAMRLVVVGNVIGVLPYALVVLGWFPTTGTTAATAIYFGLVILSTGAGIAVMITALSMMADVTTAYQEQSGKAQEGTFFAGYFFTQKCVTGVGILLSGQVLRLIDFPANARPDTVPTTVIDSLALLYVILTLCFGLATAWALSRFPIDRKPDAVHVETVR